MESIERGLKFSVFVESLRTSDNGHLIDAVLQGYEANAEMMLEGVGDTFRKVLMGIAMLASASSARDIDMKKLDSLVNLALGVIEDVAEHSSAGRYDSRVGEMASQLNGVIKDVAPDKAEDYQDDINEFVLDGGIKTAGGNDVGVGSPSRVTSVRGSREDALKELGGEGDVEETNVSRGGMFSKPEKGYYARPKGTSLRQAARQSFTDVTRQIGGMKYGK